MSSPSRVKLKQGKVVVNRTIRLEGTVLVSTKLTTVGPRRAQSSSNAGVKGGLCAFTSMPKVNSTPSGSGFDFAWSIVPGSPIAPGFRRWARSQRWR
jgi:hypothetical protein